MIRLDKSPINNMLDIKLMLTSYKQRGFVIFKTTQQNFNIEKEMVIRVLPQTFSLLSIFLLALLLASTSIASEKKAVDFTLPDLISMQQAKLSDYKGKVIYLDFWASWCGPCRKSFPALNTLYQEFKDQGLIIVGINLDEDIEKAKQFTLRHPVKFKLLHDKEGLTPRMYNINTMPSAFIIDRQGIIRQAHSGFSKNDISGIRKTIISLLNEDKHSL